MERKYRHRNKIEWLADPRHLYRFSVKTKADREFAKLFADL